MVPVYRLAKLLHAQPAALDNALQRADGNELGAVHCHDDLPPIGMPPFLMAPGLPGQREAMPP